MGGKPRFDVSTVTDQAERSRDQAIHRQRNLIERIFNGIEHLKRIAKCFDKLAAMPTPAVCRCSKSTSPDPG
jgi:transposase